MTVCTCCTPKYACLLIQLVRLCAVWDARWQLSLMPLWLVEVKMTFRVVVFVLDVCRVLA